ncbi:MAG TPA: DKNYY domain-containing protein [Candidatus Paceibacterota bacterium]|nr:DKNYY domain-containing protein [Candidatus Paceibacterota bacterium]
MRKKIIFGAAAALMLTVGGLYILLFKAPSATPVQITWLPVSALPMNWVNGQGFTWFSRQDTTVYCMGNAMPEADYATFQVSSLGNYGKDRHYVYWCNQIVNDADPATFTVINGEYAEDASHVYWEGYYLLPGADPKTFSIVPVPGSDNMQTGYGKDATHVYNLYRPLQGADAATFTLVPVPHDKNFIYQNSDVIGPVSLMTDNTQYAKALPAACNTSSTDIIYPQVYPPAFSQDGSVIGYPNDNAICIIDKNADTVQVFPYGTQQGVSISKDGLKILFFKYQKGDGEGEQACPDCGQYSYDRATGAISRVPSP